MAWRRSGHVALAVLALAVLASPASARLSQGPLEPAALAVAANGSDSSPCTPEAPCQSFDRAYRTARPGQAIQVAGGTYPAQTIPLDPAKTPASRVVFQPAPGAAVVIAGALDVYARHVEVRDLQVTRWNVRPGARDVTLVDVKTGTFSIRSGRDVTLAGGEVGPWSGPRASVPTIASSAAGRSRPPTDVVIDRASFHDIGPPEGARYHVPCLRIASAVGLQVRDSRFDRCDAHAIVVMSRRRKSMLRRITIRDDTFASVVSGRQALRLSIGRGGSPCRACRVVGNLAAKPIAVHVAAHGSHVLVARNRMPSADLSRPGWCQAGIRGVRWTANVFVHRPTCGRRAVVSPTALAGLATLSVAPDGSDANPCLPLAPCQTFGRAYAVAGPGDVVEVAGGAYPSQTIALDPSKVLPARVVFQPAPVGSVTVDGTLTVFAQHVELREMTISAGWYVREGAADVTFRDVATRTFSIGSATGVSVIGGEVGPLTATSGDPDPKVSKSSPASPTSPTDVLIDGTSFHDIARAPGSGLHIECLQVGSAVNLVVENSSFQNCATQSLFVRSWGPGYVLQGITIRSDTFEAVPQGYHSAKIDVQAGDLPCVGCSIVGSTAEKPIATNVEAPGSSILVSGNRMPSADLAAPGWCDAGLDGVVWDANVFSHTPTCGTNAVVAP